MDGKLILTEKKIPARYFYDYADREGFTHLLKMITISFVNALPGPDGYSPPNLGRMPYHS